ncbi:MAG TPA: type II toxin-antitoxin system Phd/YefM family antitoxin [Solirubrobacteraceae bacterium]|jgi:prevent-host-death family protein|nr:type II toxin-antitoxin system Phd/YefM family antitoxin [Solirubrobacteraceae bacterium]
MSLIGSRTLHRKTKDVLDHVEHGGGPVVILRHGRPAAAIMPIDEELAKTLVLASSLMEEPRTSLGAPAERQPFAVAEREIGTEEATPDEDSVAATSEETSRLIAVTAQRLSQQLELLREGAIVTAGGTHVDLDTSLVLAHRRTAMALAEVVEGFREQTETLNALASGEARGDTV